MPFPIVPFMLGAAAGSATAYIVTNKMTREKIEQSVGKVAGSVKSGAKTSADAVKKGAKISADAVKKGAKAGAEAVKSGAKAGAEAVKSGAKAVKAKLPTQKTPAAEDEVEQPSATENKKP